MDPEVANREVQSDDGWRVPASVPMAQAILHAGEHRTYVLSILGGALGIEAPEPNGLDTWGYAEDARLMTPITDSSP